MWLGFRIAEGRVAAAASKAFPYSSSTSTFLLSSMGEDDEDGGGVDVDGLLLRMEARLSFSRLS